MVEYIQDGIGVIVSGDAVSSDLSTIQTQVYDHQFTIGLG